MLQFRRDLKLVAAARPSSAIDEFWCGEHHSTGWEMIASPELFLAAAGERTHRIRLGTGVISLPYHHPFNVAQRIVQLDHMTRRSRDLRVGARRAAVGRPHARHRPDHRRATARTRRIGVITRLLRGEPSASATRATGSPSRRPAPDPARSRRRSPMAVASMISPSGMTLAGKYGIGVLSIGSMSTEGLAGPADAVELRRGVGRAKHGQIGRPRQLARADDAGTSPRAASRPAPGSGRRPADAGTTSTPSAR